MNNLKTKLSLERSSPNIFDFNHISKDLSEDIEKHLKDFYKFYHKKWWCYNKAFKNYKRKSLSLTILSAGSIISGAAAGGVTLNPIIIGVLTSIGVISKVLSNFKKYDKKVESTRYAPTTYKKVLDELRMYLRGGNQMYNHEDFVKSMKIIDDVIVDNFPEVKAYWGKKYLNRFGKRGKKTNNCFHSCYFLNSFFTSEITTIPKTPLHLFQ